ncbi:mixed lineage kinase domain-like protein [Diretmus argenteus]
MDFIDPILTIASAIYSLAEEVKANKKRCSRVADRVKALEKPVLTIKERGPGQASDNVEKCLKELKITLESAVELIRKYTSSNFLKRMLKAFSYGDEFSSVNERLNDAYQVLSLSLQIDDGNKIHKVFEITSRETEDQVDGKEDDAELKKLLLQFMEKQETINVRVATTTDDLKENVETILKILNKPSMISQAIREIKPEELTYDFPKEPFMKTSNSEVYKGEYKGFTVAIKRYTDPMSTCPGSVRKIFLQEVENMRRFESPSILRMFGICVQGDNGPNPNFLIIMEYCEKGSLREVLDSPKSKLSWNRKAHMCLDAAQGLYRLHQTEEKSKVHGSLNSSRFLVAAGYRVKLGGLELAKTETSLNRGTKKKNISSLCYTSPQGLESIHHKYTKECEMYSFGIVLWEIATRNEPYKGHSREEIRRRVVKEKYQEPLPDDCPKSLGDLINACRAYDSFSRPSAGVLVDKLRKVVEQLEEE